MVGYFLQLVGMTALWVIYCLWINGLGNPLLLALIAWGAFFFLGWRWIKFVLACGILALIIGAGVMNNAKKESKGLGARVLDEYTGPKSSDEKEEGI